MKKTSLVSVDDLDLFFITKVFAAAKDYKHRRQLSREKWNEVHGRLQNHLLISDFFEPSTRTRFSFEAAMSYLGGMVIGTENAAEFSSFKKRESLSDNFRVISGLCDIIVGRFKNEGDARIAADNSLVPVINGGDGKGEHPTQALVDLFSIIEKHPEPENLRITFVGDNKHSRTVWSLAKTLAKFPCVSEMTFLGPKDQNFKAVDVEKIYDAARDFNQNLVCFLDGPFLGRYGRKFDDEQMGRTDVLYMTRSQVERHQTIPSTSVLDPDRPTDHDYHMTWELAQAMPNKAIILHPLPRNSELPEEIDQNIRAYYFQQAHNGLYVRMALLELLCLQQ